MARPCGMPWLPTYMSHGWGKGVRKGRDNEDLRTIDSDETRLDQSAIANKRLSTPARHHSTLDSSGFLAVTSASKT